MPQRKRDNCREPAVPGGKRYCPQHLAEYRAARARRAKMLADTPICADATCGEHIGYLRAANGETLCRDCAERHERRRQTDALAAARREAAEMAALRAKHFERQLAACETLDDVKAFLADFFRSKGMF